MAVIEGGTTAALLETDSKHLAARISGRPMELGTRGSYALAVTSGVMAAGLASNAEIGQMRWVHSTFACLIRSVTISIARGTTAFTAGPGEVNLTMARSWSADGGAGTAVVMSTNNTNKRRTSFPLSAFSDTGVRFSATAACTAGTKTLDTNKLAAASFFISSAATSLETGCILPPTILWQRNTHDEYPLLLLQNEGIVIRATVPATGTWQFSIGVEWAEIDPTAVSGWT